MNPKDIENLSSVLEGENAAGGPSSEGATTRKQLDSEEELDILNDMIQTSQFHHPHHRAFQVSHSLNY